jgi:hypothetical protein
VQRGVLVLVDGVHGRVGFEEDLGALQLAVAAGEVEAPPSFRVLLVLVNALLQRFLQTLLFVCLAKKKVSVKRRAIEQVPLPSTAVCSATTDLDVADAGGVVDDGLVLVLGFLLLPGGSFLRAGGLARRADAHRTPELLQSFRVVPVPGRNSKRLLDLTLSSYMMDGRAQAQMQSDSKKVR